MFKNVLGNVLAVLERKISFYNNNESGPTVGIILSEKDGLNIQMNPQQIM
jgi:hypothetical protein